MKFKAFSYNEILIVAAIMVVLFALSTPFYLRMIHSNDVTYNSDFIVRYLRSAQINSIIGKDNAEWGVCKVGTQIVMYKVSCANGNYVHEYEIKGSVNITGLDNILFESKSGNTNMNHTIIIESGGVSEQIVLNAIGGYEIN